MAASAHLAQGWALLFTGRFRDGIVSFGLAAHDYRAAAEALYGTGVAHLSLHEDVQAETALWHSLRQAPRNADAVFYLGLIAERRGRPREAEGRYREALALDGDHANARIRLAAIRAGTGVRPSTVPLPAAPPQRTWAPAVARPAASLPPPGPAEPDEARRLVESLRLSVRPRAIAYLGSLDREVLAPLPVRPAGAAVLLALWAALFPIRASLPPLRSLVTLAQAVAGVGAALQALGLVLTAVRASRTTVSIERGRVRVEGDPARPGVVTTLDLARVEQIDLRRTGLHPLTGDGTLVLTAPDATVLLCGVARGSELTQLYRQLLDVVEHLRAG